MENTAGNGIAAFRYHHTVRDLLSFGHHDIGKVRIHGMESAGVSENNKIAVRRQPVNHRHFSVGNGFHGRPAFDGNVDSGILRYRFQHGMHMVAKMSNDSPCRHRPVQFPFQ